MAATRRERLAALSGQSGREAESGREADKREAGATEDNSEGGFPFAVLQGSGHGVDTPVFESRIKTPEEKPKPEKSEKPTPKRAGTATERQLEEIRESLQDKTDELAIVIAGITPVTSVYLAENGPLALNALLNIAKRRPAMLKVLSKAADGIDAMTVGKFALGFLTALQVDFGRLQPDSMPARVTGVTAVIEEHLSPEDKPNPAVTFQAPQYVPVV